MGQSLPLGNAYGESGWIPQDVFSKSEKWIGNPPSGQHEFVDLKRERSVGMVELHQ